MLRPTPDQGHRPPANVLLFAAACGAALFLTGTLLPPLLEATGRGWGTLLRILYLPICHQSLPRSLSIGAYPLAVCARCEGLYLGGVLALAGAALARRRIRLTRPILGATVVPTLLDVAVGLAGLEGADNWLRFALAVPAGAAAGLLLAEALQDAGRRWRCRIIVLRDTEGGFP